MLSYIKYGIILISGNMKLDLIFNCIFLFFVYSFIGWVLEVFAVAVKEKKFVNRGITNGPICPIYGFVGVLLTIAFSDVSNIVVIFFGSVIYATIIEFITGKILEKLNKSKWWDYSKRKFNLDGYICLAYSFLWGILGTIGVKLFSPLLTFLYHYISTNILNSFIVYVLLIALLAIFFVDILTSFVTIEKIKTEKIENASNKIGNWILKSVQKRLFDAYPLFKKKKKNKDNTNFAEGLSFYKLFILFIIGAFVGDLIEIFFCRYSMGRWMSRSSLVWGQFSIVWGFALVLIVLLLHRYRDKSNTFLFIFGTIMGGAYEYICSVFTEFFFGTIFWDYSKIPLNINGRINLLFCFFWGIATIIFIRGLYPSLTKMIESIPKKMGKLCTNILLIFIVADLLVTGCAMMRHKNRLDGIQASNIVEKFCDKYFDDEFMIERWPNMKLVKNLKKD